jgi:hypothetical protein
LKLILCIDVFSTTFIYLLDLSICILPTGTGSPGGSNNASFVEGAFFAD